MPSNSAFKALLLKIIFDEISVEEKSHYYDMILTENLEQDFKTAFEELAEERKEVYSNFIFIPEEWIEIKSKILKGESIPAVPLNERTIPERLVRRMPLRKINWIAAAAASVLILISLGFYLKNIVRPKTVMSTANKPTIKKDIEPASNKAVLILSNGQTIILDSVKNGQLAKFGNTTISKTDSGKLLYTSSGSKVEADETSYNTLITPRGGIYELTLPDGTNAWLNAASRIDYPTRFTSKKREVFIYGEVYFEVAMIRSILLWYHPTPKTNGRTETKRWMQIIEVLGTHFNVEVPYSDNEKPVTNTATNSVLTRTTLLEGSIRISAHDQIKTIKPNEQAITSLTSKSIQIDQHVNIAAK